MYSCGPTVYNYAHIGNMRAFLFADFLQRVLRTVGGYDMKWVMNITNIDDKTIRDSALGSNQWKAEMGEQTSEPKENLAKLTAFYEDSFVSDISRLGIRREHFFAMPRATEYIKGMQELILALIEKGFAYVSESSVYFNVAAWRKVDVYGKLFKIDFDNFMANMRIDSDQYERESVSDFALWKTKKEGEPYWEFDINGVNCDGRPGWHIECSVMEKELLGLPFDIHTGGIDLKFPHHEDEIAQSKAGYGIEPTAFWCHNEFLEVEGEKMSKSLGNFFTLRDLEEKGLDPLDIRFAMLSAHYSSTYNFTFDGVEAAKKAKLRVQEYIYSLFDEASGTLEISAEEAERSVFSELANDLHSPKALGALFTFINKYPADKMTSESKQGLIEFFRKLNEIYEVWKIEEKKEVFPDEVIKIANERLEARNQKNWAESDRLRNLISELGFAIKDSKEGYTLSKL